MDTSMATSVAMMTAGPMSPTMLPPVVNSPTPITVPTVMVTASRSPNCRRSRSSSPVGLLSSKGALMKVPSAWRSACCPNARNAVAKTRGSRAVGQHGIGPLAVRPLL